MQSWWKGTSRTQFLDAERRMLVHTGISEDQFDIQNIQIDDDSNCIRTIQVGDRSKKRLVLVHGYGGSGIMFWKIIKPIAEKYHLILVDILGMGGSSRPKLEISGNEQGEDFLVEQLEKWRVSFGDIKDFILAGHSLGGFTVGLYAIKYHQYIKKLLMLSPAGVHSRPEDFDLDRELDNFPPERRLPKFMYKLTPIVWKAKISPFSVMRTSGSMLANLQLNKFIQKRLRAGVIPDEEIQDYKEYLHQTLLMDGSSEYILFECFDELMFAKDPLEKEHRLGQLPIPVSFFYGAQDWIKRSGGDNVVAQNPFNGTLSHVHIIDNSDHHMYWDNPEEFARKILEDLELVHPDPELLQVELVNLVDQQPQQQLQKV